MLKLAVGPIVEPITLFEAKEHLRVDHNDEDALIANQISAARLYCEKLGDKAFITQTWDMYLDGFPGTSSYGVCATSYSSLKQEIRILKSPIQTISWVKYLDGDRVLQTVDAASYQVDTVGNYPRILPTYGSTWPATYVGLNAVWIQFVCGYGMPKDVPFNAKAAILLILSMLYEHRGDMPGSDFSDAQGTYKAARDLLWQDKAIFV